MPTCTRICFSDDSLSLKQTGNPINQSIKLNMYTSGYCMIIVIRCRSRSSSSRTLRIEFSRWAVVEHEADNLSVTSHLDANHRHTPPHTHRLCDDSSFPEEEIFLLGSVPVPWKGLSSSTVFQNPVSPIIRIFAFIILFETGLDIGQYILLRGLTGSFICFSL